MMEQHPQNSQLLLWLAALFLSVFTPVCSPQQDCIKNNPSKIDAPALKYADFVEYYVAENDFYFVMVLALIEVESSGRPWVVSSSNAIGLMQILPSTARMFDPDITEEELKDPETNIRIGYEYLKYLDSRLKQRAPYLSKEERIMLLAACWNAGPTYVLKHLRIPNYPETQKMVKRTLKAFNKYSELLNCY